MRFWADLGATKAFWSRTASAIWLAVVAVFVLCLSLMWVNKSIHIQSDVFKLLPAFSDNPTLLQYNKLLSERLNNKVFIMLQSNNKDDLNRATDTLNAAKANSDIWGTDDVMASVEDFGKVLFTHRAGLMDSESATWLSQKNYDAFTESGLLQVYSPTMPVSEELLKDDPFLLLPKYALQKANDGLVAAEMEYGYPTLSQTQGDNEIFYRLITVSLAKSPYDLDFQTKAGKWLDDVAGQIEQQQTVKMTWTGTLAFAGFGTRSAKDEISTIGLGSSLGVLLLVLFGFRSIRPMVTEFVAVSVGSLMAFVLTHLLFGEIHLMTLVFGASLIGVCVDFSFYFMAMQSLHQSDEKDGFAILIPLLPSLFVGLMTTLVAYVFLIITPFPAFRQIAVFSAVGLASAWITSVLLLPRLPALNAKPAYEALSFLGRFREKMVPYRKKRLVMIGLCLVVAMMGLANLQFNDDVKNLQSVNKTLVATDKAIRERFSQNSGGQYFIVTGDDIAQTRWAEQQLLSKLAPLVKNGTIQSVQAVGQWINPDEQTTNIAHLQAIPKTVLKDYANLVGLEMADMVAWQESLAELPKLSEEQFKTHPLSELILSDTARVVLVSGSLNNSALQALQTNTVHFMAPTQTLSDAFAKHRKHAQVLLVSAIVILCGIVWALYGYKSVLPIVLPVSLALGLTFGIQGFLGIEPNLFSIMGCFLVLGIGVDYAIFYRHAQNTDRIVAMALFLCMISTLLGFGLLSLSSTYAIFCFGFTVLCGVILSFVFATCLTPTDPDYVS